MIADAVFLIIGIVGVGRTEDVPQIVVVGRVLIGVAHNKSNGAASSLPFHHAAE